MSNFECEKCGTAIIDSPRGYVTGCDHYPLSGIEAESVMTCYSCHHYRRIQEGPTAWRHECKSPAASRNNDCPNADSRLCDAFCYEPGSDEEEMNSRLVVVEDGPWPSFQK